MVTNKLYLRILVWRIYKLHSLFSYGIVCQVFQIHSNLETHGLSLAWDTINPDTTPNFLKNIQEELNLALNSACQVFQNMYKQFWRRRKMCGKICHEICDEICDEICHENMLMSKWLFNFSLQEWFLYMIRNVTKCVTFSMQNVTKIYNICGGEGWGGLWNTSRTKNVYNEK